MGAKASNDARKYETRGGVGLASRSHALSITPLMEARVGSGERPLTVGGVVPDIIILVFSLKA